METVAYRHDLIRVELARKNMRHEELAQKSGVNRSTISGIVNGKTDPLVSTLAKIANALGISLSQLFTENTENQ